MNDREDDSFGDKVKAVLTVQNGRCEMDEFVAAFCKMYNTQPPQHPSSWQALPVGVALDEDYIFLITHEQEINDENEHFTPETRIETPQRKVKTHEVSGVKNVITLVDNTKNETQNVITLVDNTNNDSQNVDELDLVDELFKESILEIMKAHTGRCPVGLFRNEFKKTYGKHLWQHLNQPSRWLSKFHKDFSFHKGHNCYVPSLKHKTSVIGTQPKVILDKNSGNNEDSKKLDKAIIETSNSPAKDSFENQVKAVLAKQNGRCEIDEFMDAFFQTYNTRPVHPSCWQEVPQGVYVQDSYILQVMPQGVGIKDNCIFLVTQETKDKDNDDIIIIDDNDDKTPNVKKNKIVENINKFLNTEYSRDDLLIKRIVDIMKAHDGKCEIYKFCNEFKKSYGFFPKPPNNPEKWLDHFPNDFCFLKRDRCFGFVSYVPSRAKTKPMPDENQDEIKANSVDEGLRRKKALTDLKHLYRKRPTKYLFVENLSPDTDENALKVVFDGCVGVRILTLASSRKPCSNSVLDEIKKKYNSSGLSIQEIQQKYSNPSPKKEKAVQEIQKNYKTPSNTDSKRVNAGVTSGDQGSSQQEEKPLSFALLEFMISSKTTKAFLSMSGKTINDRQVHLEFAADKGSEGFVLRDKEELLPISERRHTLKRNISDCFTIKKTTTLSKIAFFSQLKSRYQDLDCKEFCQEFFNISDKDEILEVFNDVLKFDETENTVTLKDEVIDKDKPVNIVVSDEDIEIDCEIDEDVPYNKVTLHEDADLEVVKDEWFISNLTTLLGKHGGLISKAHTLESKYLSEFGTALPHSLYTSHKIIKQHCPYIQWPAYTPYSHIKLLSKKKKKKKNVPNIMAGIIEEDPNTKFEYSQITTSDDKPRSTKRQDLKDIICGLFKHDPKMRLSNKGFFKKLRSTYPQIDQRGFVQECFDISDKCEVFDIFDDILKVDETDKLISLLVSPEQEKQVAIVTPMVALAKQADVDQKRQELLAKQIQQQKLLIDTLEKKKSTLSEAEREGLMGALRKISETVDIVLTTVSKKPVSGAGKALAAAQTKTVNQESNGQFAKAQDTINKGGFKSRRAFSRPGFDSKSRFSNVRGGHQGHGQGQLVGRSSTFHNEVTQNYQPLKRPLMQTHRDPYLEESKVRRMEMPPERMRNNLPGFNKRSMLHGVQGNRLDVVTQNCQPLKRPLMQIHRDPSLEESKVRRIMMSPERMRNNVPAFNQRSMLHGVQGYRGNQEIIQSQYIESGIVRPKFSENQQRLTEEIHIKTSYRQEIYKESNVIEKVHRPPVYMEDIQCGLSNIDKIQRGLEEKKQRELKIIEERLKELKYIEERQSIEERLKEIKNIEERQREPRYRDERQREPRYREERQREPIYREDRQREPIFRKERQQEPMFREERQRKPMFREERQREPHFREERPQKPSYSEERPQEPSFRDERHTLVTYPGFGGGTPRLPSYMAERQVEPTYRNVGAHNMYTREPRR